jgi:hypothetical protein
MFPDGKPLVTYTLAELDFLFDSLMVLVEYEGVAQ